MSEREPEAGRGGLVHGARGSGYDPGFVPMDPCRDVVLSDLWIEALLHEPLVRWPEVSPVAVREIVESTDGVGTAILAVVVDAASPERSGLTEQVIAALSEAVAGTYPAWLPEAEHLAGPGGAGLAAVRTICERVACSTDLFGPFLIGVAEASLCRRPVGVAGFAQETAVRQARKLILRAYGYGRLVISIELTGTWSTAQIEVAEANALWLAGPGELTVWLFGASTAYMTRVPRSFLHDRMPASDPPAMPRAAYLTPLRGRPNAFSRAETHLEAHLARSPWATGRAWNQTWSSSVLANSIRGRSHLVAGEVRRRARWTRPPEHGQVRRRPGARSRAAARGVHGASIHERRGARRCGPRPRRARTIPGRSAAVQDRGDVRWRMEFPNVP